MWVTPGPVSPQARRLIAAQIAVQAVDAAPRRLNAVIAGAPVATADLVRFLLQAGAVTGQLIAADLGEALAHPPATKAAP